MEMWCPQTLPTRTCTRQSVSSPSDLSIHTDGVNGEFGQLYHRKIFHPNHLQPEPEVPEQAGVRELPRQPRREALRPQSKEESGQAVAQPNSSRQSNQDGLISSYTISQAVLKRKSFKRREKDLKWIEG